jgi:hypothetical protein
MTTPLGPLHRRLAWWERQWRKLLENPEALLLHDRAVPVLVALAKRLPTKPFDPATDFIDQATGSVRFRSVLATRVRQLLPLAPTPADHIFAILGARYGPDVSTLQHAIHQTPVDPAAVRPPLSALLHALDTDTGALLDVIDAELHAPDSLESRGRILAATEALLRRLVMIDDPKNIARALEDSLTIIGVTEALNDAPTDIASSLVSELWLGIRECTRIVADADDLEARLGDVHDPERDLHFLMVRGLARLLEDIPAPPAIPATDGGSSADWTIHAATAEKLGRDAVAVWSGHWMHWLLGRLTRLRRDGDPVAIEFSSRIDALARQQFAQLRALPTINDPSEDGDSSELLSAVSDGTEQVVRRTIQAAVIDSFRVRYEAASARALGFRLSDALTEEAHQVGAGWPPQDSVLRERVALRAAARSDVQEALTGAVWAAVPMLATVLRDAASELTARDSTPTWIDDDAGWKRWTHAISAQTMRGARAWRCIAWEHLAGAPRAVLQRVAAPLLGTMSYEVVFTVDGVDAQGEAWDAGGIAWYAANRFNFGERMGHDDHDLGSIMRAWVRIDAATKAQARARAREVVEAALNTTTFLLSVDRRASGLRSAVAHDAFAGRSDGGAASRWGGREKEELYDVQNVTDGQFKAATLDGAALVERVATLAPLSTIDVRLLRAEAWYREGRWDPNPVTRFLTYFVALEHVFLAGRRGEKYTLSLKVPAFTESWAWMRSLELDRVQRIIAEAEAVRAGATPAVVAILDSDPAMVHWRTDVRPLLVRSAVQRAGRQLAAAAATAEMGAQAFVAYAARLDAFASAHVRYDASRAAARARWRFTMELLMARRDEIAHEAITGGTDDQIYARALEHALAAAIKHLRIMREIAHVQDVDDAVAWCEPPWLE